MRNVLAFLTLTLVPPMFIGGVLVAMFAHDADKFGYPVEFIAISMGVALFMGFCGAIADAVEQADARAHSKRMRVAVDTHAARVFPHLAAPAPRVGPNPFTQAEIDQWN